MEFLRGAAELGTLAVPELVDHHVASSLSVLLDAKTG